MPRKPGKRTLASRKAEDALVAKAQSSCAKALAFTMRPATRLMSELTALIKSEASDGMIIAKAREVQAALPDKFRELRKAILARSLYGVMQRALLAGAKSKRAQLQGAL